MEQKILEIIADESKKAGVRKYTCINDFGYSQFERNLAERIVKLFAIPTVIKSVCPDCDGTGKIKIFEWRLKKCQKCNGTGQTVL